MFEYKVREGNWRNTYYYVQMQLRGKNKTRDHGPTQGTKVSQQILC